MGALRPAPKGYPIKIVRDRTAEIVNPTGEPGDLWYGPGPGSNERHRWLKLKLSEELGEYLVDGGRDELEDVLAVIEGLAYCHGTTLEGLITVMRADSRGGFLNGVMMYGRHKEFDGD